MDGRRFDTMTRALGRRLDRRRVLGGMVLAALGGGWADAGAATCVERGRSCRSGRCCSGLVCDATVRLCREPRSSGPCRTSQECALGSTCRNGSCQSSVACRTAKQSCSSSASRQCCAGLGCERGTCKGKDGAACASASDCVAGLICGHGVCRESCVGRCDAGLTCTAEGDCVDLARVCDFAGLPGGNDTVYAACHITRDGIGRLVCQNLGRDWNYGVRTGRTCDSSAACQSWCTSNNYAGCACSLHEKVSNGAPRAGGAFPGGACVGWNGTFTPDTINDCIRS